MLAFHKMSSNASVRGTTIHVCVQEEVTGWYTSSTFSAEHWPNCLVWCQKSRGTGNKALRMTRVTAISDITLLLLSLQQLGSWRLVPEQNAVCTSASSTVSFLQWRILLITFSSLDFASVMRPVSGNKGIFLLKGNVNVQAAFYDFVFVSEIWDKKLSYDSTVVGSIPQHIHIQCSHSLPLDMNPKVLK